MVSDPISRRIFLLNTPKFLNPERRTQARSAFSLTGQRCNASRRAVVTAEVHDELVGRIARHAAEMVVGDPLEKDSFIGPLIDPGVVERYAEGTVAFGGERLERDGYFVEPALMATSPSAMRSPGPSTSCRSSRSPR